MWLFSYELNLEALEKNTKIYTKKRYWIAWSWVSVCETLFYEWKSRKYMKKSYNNSEEISWISIKRINNQHSLFWFKFRRKKRKNKNVFQKRILFSFFFGSLLLLIFGISADFSSVSWLTLALFLWTKR